MAITATIAAVGVGLQVHGMEEQRKAANKSESAQRKANDVEQAKTSVDRARARRRAIAEARMRQAQNEAIGVGQGVSGSSLEQGAQASIQSNIASSFAADTRQLVSGNESFGLRQYASNQMAKGQRRASNFAALSSFALQGAQAGATYFGGKTPPTTPQYTGAGSLNWQG